MREGQRFPVLRMSWAFGCVAQAWSTRGTLSTVMVTHGAYPAVQRRSQGVNVGRADLLVELVHVVVGLVLGLDESGVLLDFLRCRHL